ncbi:MAG: hypothetical protein GEU73_14840 [Chloroflexi bacterium]|nr:hypothetical protein [Chloroflexota bacterium]
MARWSPGERVVVLGAGATRGAEFVVAPPSGVAPPKCLPPLNADFFTQLQRVTTERHQEAVRAVVRDVVGIYGPNFSLTLEQYFTQLEAMLATARPAKVVAESYKPANLSSMRTSLLDALSAVLEESADVAKMDSLARRHPCSYHASLVNILEPQDTIISFNYDCVMDHALRTTGVGKWSARFGYTFPNANRVEGYSAWSAQRAPTAHNRSINLIKLHGSLNWYPFPESEREPLRLRERPYKQRGQKLYEIVPPEYVKSATARPIYPILWANAELALRRAELIAFVGFSFTPTDLDVEALFRLAMASNKKLKRVVIANPNDEHRWRIRSILATALQDGAVVTQFDSFRDLAPHLNELFG